MTAFLLLPGAGGAGSYWDRVVPLLEAAGHTAVAVDLPAADPSAGLPEYADIACAAGDPLGPLVLVAQSMGGFTAPLAADRLPVTQVVLVNAMIPVPGERAGDWWANVGAVEAREAKAAEEGYGPFALETYFLHDVDTRGLREDQQDEADRAFETPCAFERWPDVPIRVLAGADDRFFPATFQQRVARERLGVEADLRPGGHLIALARPEEVVAYLLA